jgi:hypothetical protein
MNRRLASNIREAERLICINIKSFIADLCLIDKSFLIENVINANHNNINDVIESSSEMFFKPGTLCYAFSSRLTERYNTVPAISLDMRFSHKHVLVPFLLHIEDDFVGVSLADTKSKNKSPSIALSQLSDALYEARIYDRFNTSSPQDTISPQPPFCH